MIIFFFDIFIPNLLNRSVENVWHLFEFNTTSIPSKVIQALSPIGTRELPNF